MNSEKRTVSVYYKRTLIMFLLFPFIGGFIMYLLGEIFAMPLIFLYIIYFLYLATKWMNFNCPDCLNPFFRHGIFFSVMPRCVHCKQPLFPKESMH